MQSRRCVIENCREHWENGCLKAVLIDRSSGPRCSPSRIPSGGRDGMSQEMPRAVSRICTIVRLERSDEVGSFKQQAIRPQPGTYERLQA